VEAGVWRAVEIRAREARLMELIRDTWNIDLPGVQIRLDQSDPMRLRSDVA
jgi:hypothetical protein